MKILQGEKAALKKERLKAKGLGNVKKVNKSEPKPSSSKSRVLGAAKKKESTLHLVLRLRGGMQIFVKTLTEINHHVGGGAFRFHRKC